LLFAGFGEEDDVAGEGLAAAMDLEECFEVRGEGALVVGGSAAVEGAVVHAGGEGVEGPVGAVDWDDVFVSEHENGLFGAGAFEAGYDTGTSGDGLEDLVGDVFAVEDSGDVGGDFGLVARRVGCVQLDEVFEEFGGFGGGLVGG